MIRELNEKDKEVFITMVSDFYQSEAVIHSIPLEYIEKTFEEIISDSPFIKTYIIEEQEKPAGYALLSFTYSNEAGGLVVLVEELYINEAFRGLGLGSKLLDYIHEEYANKAARFRLEITKTNESAKRLYLRKGYSILEYGQMIMDNKDR